MTTLTEIQNRLREFDKQGGWDKDPHEVNFMCLTTEIGELSKEIIEAWIETGKLIKTGTNYKEARNRVLAERKDRIADEIADCIIFLLKVANYLKIDVGKALNLKIAINEKRVWDIKKSFSSKSVFTDDDRFEIEGKPNEVEG